MTWLQKEGASKWLNNLPPTKHDVFLDMFDFQNKLDEDTKLGQENHLFFSSVATTQQLPTHFFVQKTKKLIYATMKPETPLQFLDEVCHEVKPNLDFNWRKAKALPT